MQLLTPLVSITLIPFLIAPLPAQTNLPADALQPTQALQIRLVEGDGSTVLAGSASKKGFTVEVSDGSGRAIADAAVAFRLPDSGATGVFQDGGHANVAYTDSAGRAHFSGIRWSNAPGAASIRITASKGNAHAGMLLEETLSAATAAVVPAAVTPVAPITSAAATVTPLAPAASITPATSSKPAGSAPAQPGKVDPITTDTHSPAQILPARPQTSPTQTSPTQPTSAASDEPAVSVTHSSAGAGATHSSKTKWIILAAVIAGGAGAAVAFAGKGKSSAATSNSSLSIGSPTVSIGHP